MLHNAVDRRNPKTRVPDPSPLPERIWEEVFVLVPACNEATSIEGVVKQLGELGAQVVVIDDGSQDETAARARAAGALVLRHLLNRGQGAALQTGFDYALRRGASYVITFDADGQHSVDDLPRLLQPLVEGRAEVALGSRFLGNADHVPPARRWLLRVATHFTRLASGLPLTDTHNGLRALTRNAVARLDLSLDRMAHASQLLDQVARARLPFVEVPVRVSYTNYTRAKGQSGLAAIPVTLDYLVSRILE